MEKFDVTIIGAGPAGIFAALYLSEVSRQIRQEIKILLIDKGRRLEDRICPSNQHSSQPCAHCEPCSQMCGFGGAGTFSDCKLNIATTVLGDVRMTQYMTLDQFQRYVQIVDQTWVKIYSAPIAVYGADDEKVIPIKKLCDKAGVELVVGKIRPVGTDMGKECIAQMQKKLENRVQLLFNCPVKEVITERSGLDRHRVMGVLLENGTEIQSDYVLACPGREGASWLEGEFKRLKIEMEIHPVDLGIRVEIPQEISARLTDVLYEPKLFYRPSPFRDQVRTFCVCPRGSVTLETVEIGGRKITSVNGHSYRENPTASTNFAMLIRTDFTEPFKDPTQYGADIAHLSNLLSGGNVLVQRLADILAGRRSNEHRMGDSRTQRTMRSAVPGDLTFVLPYRHMKGLLETLQTYEMIMPGIFTRATDTLLYGAEVKFYSNSPRVNQGLEVEGVVNLFVGGDGAGISRNLVHAAASGLFAAETILAKMNVDQYSRRMLAL